MSSPVVPGGKELDKGFQNFCAAFNFHPVNSGAAAERSDVFVPLIKSLLKLGSGTGMKSDKFPCFRIFKNDRHINGPLLFCGVTDLNGNQIVPSPELPQGR